MEKNSIGDYSFFWRGGGIFQGLDTGEEVLEVVLIDRLWGCGIFQDLDTGQKILGIVLFQLFIEALKPVNKVPHLRAEGNVLVG